MTTHHEAAHAVVALRLGWTVHHIVIDNYSSGLTCSDPPEEPGDWREYCMIRVAGVLAERRLPNADDGLSAVAEDERASALAPARDNVGDDAESEIATLEARSAAILASDWGIVTKVAAYLEDHSLYPRQLLDTLAIRGG